MGTNTVTHLLHVLVPNHLYLRDTNIRAGLCIDLGTDMPRSLFISLRPLGPYWSIVNATPYTMGQTNSFQLQLAWRPSGWFIALFSFPCIPSRINHPPTLAHVILTSSTCQGSRLAVHSWISFPPLSILISCPPLLWLQGAVVVLNFHLTNQRANQRLT